MMSRERELLNVLAHKLAKCPYNYIRPKTLAAIIYEVLNEDKRREQEFEDELEAIETEFFSDISNSQGG